jgi:hypothetical protein
MQTDPAEQKNLADIESYNSILKKMKEELSKLRSLYDDHEPAGILK